MTQLRRNFLNILVTIPILLFAFTIIKNAWVCDDAYITFRTIDNFVNGYGLTWNVGHRVQSYTHPLWMFLNAAAYVLTGEIYFTTLLLSILLSLTTVYIVSKGIALSPYSAIIAITILIFSQAFTDYSTSGLENPLTFFCLAFFFWIYLRTDLVPTAKLFYLSIFAALGILNRLDTALLYLPALASIFFPIRSFRTLKLIALGFLPLAAWEIFSIIYYGFPIPNTAYAKLNTSILATKLLQQGLYYYRDSFVRDPLTLLAITGSLIIPFFVKERRLIPIALGTSAYLLYVLKIGGDFMTGRFFAAPLLLSAILIAQVPLHSIKRALLLLASILLIGLATPKPPIFTTNAYGSDKTQHEFTSNSEGIVDERAYYFQGTGLVNVWSQGEPHHYFANHGRWLRQNPVAFPMTEGTVGLLAYYAGPNIHFSDIYALTDPLLSRLPVDDQIHWRIGHFQRRAPSGYLQTLHKKQNHIRNADLAKFYNHLQTITQGDLFTTKRWTAIWQANTGGYRSLLQPQWEYANLENQTAELMQQHRLIEAIVPITKALQIDETQADGWYILAQLQHETDQLEKAYESIVRAIALEGKSMDYRFLHIQIAYAFHTQGNTDRARLLFHEALQSAKVSEVHLKVGKLLTELGQADWALEVFQSVVNHDMKTARYWYFPDLQGAQEFTKQQKSQAFTHIACILFDRNDKKNAHYCIEQALRLDPKNQEAKQYLSEWKQPLAAHP